MFTSPNIKLHRPPSQLTPAFALYRGNLKWSSDEPTYPDRINKCQEAPSTRAGG